jgi:hypothetical protein
VNDKIENPIPMKQKINFFIAQSDFEAANLLSINPFQLVNQLIGRPKIRYILIKNKYFGGYFSKYVVKHRIG